MKSSMDSSFMAQFVSFVDSVLYQKEDVSTVNYPVLLIPVLARSSIDYSLICSATLFQPSRLPSDVPSPNFQWSLTGCTSLPSGVIARVMSSSNSTSETYTSILQFTPLSQCHIGNYTCRLGPGRLMNSAMVTMNGIA